MWIRLPIQQAQRLLGSDRVLELPPVTLPKVEPERRPVQVGQQIGCSSSSHVPPDAQGRRTPTLSRGPLWFAITTEVPAVGSSVLFGITVNSANSAQGFPFYESPARRDPCPQSAKFGREFTVIESTRNVDHAAAAHHRPTTLPLLSTPLGRASV